MNFNFKWPLSFLISFLVTACTQPDSGVQEDNGANFFVKRVDVEGTQTFMKENKGWRVPVSVKYTLRACIQDRAEAKDARGHRFHVKAPDGREFEALDNTDRDGCFRWEESFPYNYFANDILYIPFDREIVGEGIYNGSRTIQFAINPWATGESKRAGGKAFVLLNDGQKTVFEFQKDLIAPRRYAQAALMGEYSPKDGKNFSELSIERQDQIKKSSAARVWVDKISYTPIKRKSLNDRMVLDVTLNMEPRLVTTNEDGELESKTIRRGNFKLIAHIVYTDTGRDGDSKMNIQPQEIVSKPMGLSNEPLGFHGKAAVDNGRLTSQIRVDWKRRAHTGNVTIALKLIPDGTSDVEAFEGLFELSGGVNAITKSSSATLLPGCEHPTDVDPNQTGFNTSYNSCQKIAPFLKNSDNYEQLKKESYSSEARGYYFDRLKLRFVSVLPGETATQRVVLYSATTCLTNAFDGSTPRNVPFVVEYLKKDQNGKGKQISEEEAKKFNVLGLDEPKRLVTTAEGCLTWNSTIHHAYYGAEKFFEHRIRIRDEKSDASKRVTFDRSFYLNPWDDKFTFGWDEDEYNSEYLSPKKAKSRFFLPFFGYHTLRFLYNIDPYMELEVKKTVLLDLQPRVLRYAGIVNARKQTEPLRDGIYLMKIAIQKNFLDPAERAVDIGEGEEPASLALGIRKSESEGEEVNGVINKSLGKVKTREYITTDQSLVRVVDGHLIHPIELTMRDLRLMRVRSNFLIQLETVDERKIQVHDTFSREVKKKLTKVARELERNRRIREQERKMHRSGTEKSVEELKSELSSDELLVEKIDEKDLAYAKAKEQEIRVRYQEAFRQMNDQLDQMSLINSDFELDKELLKPVLEVLKVNDFTDVKLPSKNEVPNLDIFAEDSGLDKRTFVGPVIFLSNNYSDSMRATDNLDEAGCEVKQEGVDDELLSRYGLGKLSLLETEFTNASGEKMSTTGKHRENSAYRYSKYYGALSHLCYKHVDDLLTTEQSYERKYKEIMPLASSKANLTRAAALDYVSLVDESLRDLPKDSCQMDSTCATLRSRSYTSAELEKVLNDAVSRNVLYYLNHNEVTELQSSPRMIDKLMPPLHMETVSDTGNEEIFREDIVKPLDIYLNCALLSSIAKDRLNLMARDDRTSSLLGGQAKRFLSLEQKRFTDNLTDQCLAMQEEDQSALILDEKIKVFQTGVDYVFRGGLQMNINVGTSVSFSRSNSYSLSFKYDDVPSAVKGFAMAAGGLEGAMLGASAGAVGGLPGMLIGGAAGAALAGSVADMGLAIIKPIGASKSQGQSNSEGTSVSDGTYLVSQMAKFDVPLLEYQRCRMVRFSHKFSQSIASKWGFSEDAAAFLGKGILICGETKKRTAEAPLRVPETYFYFTQHFTEGDMLDQADLYNHPWLLALRGVRDFGIFLRSIKAVEVSSLYGLWKDFRFGERAKGNRIAWPLDHMAVTYRQHVPSFPGF